MTEQVNHPEHYGGDTTYECIKVIHAWRLGFSLGNAVKYISRAGRKDPVRKEEDLRKAIWYIEDEIRQLHQTVESFQPHVDTMPRQQVVWIQCPACQHEFRQHVLIAAEPIIACPICDQPSKLMTSAMGGTIACLLTEPDPERPHRPTDVRVE